MGIITPSVSGLGLFVLRSIFWLCSALHGKRLTLQLHSSVSWPVGGTNARMEGRKKRDTRVISPQSCCPGWHSRSSCVSSVVLVPSELWEFYLLPFHINRKVPHPISDHPPSVFLAVSVISPPGALEIHNVLWFNELRRALPLWPLWHWRSPPRFCVPMFSEFSLVWNTLPSKRLKPGPLCGVQTHFFSKPLPRLHA